MTGIARNPAAHFGTEWLHVKILEAKIAGAKDPAWLETRSVLGLDFGTGETPSRPPTWPLGSDPKVRRALQYQLRERMGFIAAPDPVVGDLLFDLGNVLALEVSVEHALAAYDLALAYGAPKARLLKQRRAHLRSLVPWKPFGSSMSSPLKIAFVAVAGALVLLAVRRFRRRAAPAGK